MKNEKRLYSFLRSWVLRILDCPQGRTNFVRNGRFRDADVAEFLGYGEPEDGKNEDWIKLRKRFLVELREERGRDGREPIPEPLASNLRAFGKRFGLTELHGKVLLFAILRNQEETVCDAVNMIISRRKDSLPAAIARCCRAPEERIRASLAEDSPLIASGVVKNTRQGLGQVSIEVSSDRLLASFMSDDFHVEEALREIASELPPAILGTRDFPHLADECRRLREYLGRSLREKRKGVNVLLHGPPGTGKTQLARVLARGIRVRALEVSASDDEKKPVGPDQRMESLQSAQRLLAGMRLLLVFDECEDIFRGDSLFSRGAANQRKAWMNRLLENTPVPTVWISNAVWAIDDAFLRRFDLVVEMGPLPLAQRVSVYGKICGKRVSRRLIRQLAEVEGVTPAMLSRAVEVAQTTASKRTAFEQEVRDLIAEKLKAQGMSAVGLRTAGDSPVVPFSTRWINSEPGLEGIRTNLAAGALGCRLCLHGPPGTGKTAFGRWLADSLGKPLHVKRASDILSPFVGMTEIRLARAFEQAESDEAVLLIDEVDGLLRSRSEGARSWEITQVNEFLTRMETFRGLLLCSTNDWAALDPACLRRFDLKAELKFLRDDQVENLCRIYLDRLELGSLGKASARNLRGLANATPGDFAVVARRHRFQPFDTPGAFVEALRDECAMKPGSGRRRLGFLARGG